MGASIPGGLDISAPTLRGGGRREGPRKVPKVAAGASGDSHTKTQAGKEAEKDREREKIQRHALLGEAKHAQCATGLGLGCELQ